MQRDPGPGLELGRALFCHGGVALHSTVRHLLSMSNELSDKEEFTRVLTAHLARRTMGSQDSFARWRKAEREEQGGMQSGARCEVSGEIFVDS